MSGKVKKAPAGAGKDNADPEEFDLEKMEKETEEMLRLRFITRDNAVFERTEGGFVSMKMKGESYPRVQVYRSFPFTDPDAYISIREADEKAREIGIIKNLKKDVSKETRQMLEEQLRLRYFTPKIEKIINIKDEYGFAYFDVFTDHGACLEPGSRAMCFNADLEALVKFLEIGTRAVDIPNR